MREVTATGKSVPEAIETALAELKLSRDQVDIEILELPTKGLLGILAGKEAKVLVKEVFNPAEFACQWLEELIGHMGSQVRVEAVQEEETLFLNVYGRDLGALIGRHGQTLDALQYLTTLAVNKRAGKFVPLIVDVGEYRKKREESLARLAEQSARKVKKTGQKVTLNPMNAADRRIIHMTLSNDNAVNTYSVDDEPRRKVVIEKK
ncbi:MAG: protein jag [Firmicutes bacterium]|nr:protein jag [Bacillota bacterium]